MTNELPWEKGWDHKIDEEKAIACLEELDYEYGIRGITWFLIFGSLLGAVRDGGPIPGDDDIDIVVFQKDRNKIKLANDAMRDRGFWVPEKEDGMVERDEVYIKDRQKIEAWVFHDDGDYYSYDVCQPNITYPKRFFDNLTKINFGSILCNIPVESKELLELMYGSTWTTPIKGYACHQF